MQTSEDSKAPTMGDAAKQLKPIGPVCKTFIANNGSMAIAPPNRTANRSNAIELHITGVEKTNRIPSDTLSKIGPRSVGMVRLGE